MKGVSEDVPATLFVAILLVVFLLSIIHAYGNYFYNTNLIQQKRIASSIAESVAFEKKIIVWPADLDEYLNSTFNKTGVKVVINNTETNEMWKSSEKEFAQTNLVSSAAVLIYSTTSKKFYPGRIDAYVGS